MTSYSDRPAFSDLPERTSFYFVRHGESEGNRRHIVQGHLDAALTENGRTHARAAAEWFSTRHIDAVYTSPLARAADTAAEIARSNGEVEPVPLQELIELDTGIFSGLSFADAQSKFPLEYAEFRRRSWEAVPEAERMASLRKRTLVVWDRLIESAGAGNRSIVSVSHGGTIQWLIRASMGPLDYRWMPLFKASNCGIFLLVVEPVQAQDGLSPSFFAQWELMNHVPYER